MKLFYLNIGVDGFYRKYKSTCTSSNIILVRPTYFALDRSDATSIIDRMYQQFRCKGIPV